MDPHYIRPLDVQVEAVFDPASNDFFKHGRAKRFLLQDETGTTLGRVAAFVNEKKAHGFAQATGGQAVFECIDDRDAAVPPFDAAKEWPQGHGMEAREGPTYVG